MRTITFLTGLAAGLTLAIYLPQNVQTLNGGSNQKQAQPPLVENSLPLKDAAAREKTTRVAQQMTFDLLATFNDYKQAHWNLNGPLFNSLHEYYQEQADYYRGQADIFAERALSVGWSVDGRYSTVAKTSKLPEMPAGYETDNDSLKLLIARVTVLQKETYADIEETEKSDPTTSNKLQDLAYAIDKNLWQLRVHLQKPGGLGEDLPYAPAQGKSGGGTD